MQFLRRRYQDATGYFYILDRLNDMIVTGGENVYCGEVEGVIHDHPTVREAAVLRNSGCSVGRAWWPPVSFLSLERTSPKKLCWPIVAGASQITKSPGK